MNLARLHSNTQSNGDTLGDRIHCISRLNIFDGRSNFFTFSRLEERFRGEANVSIVSRISSAHSAATVHSASFHSASFHSATFHSHPTTFHSTSFTSHASALAATRSAHATVSIISFRSHTRSHTHTAISAHAATRYTCIKLSSVSVSMSSHPNPLDLLNDRLEVLFCIFVSGLDDLHDVSQKPHIFLRVVDIKNGRRRVWVVPRNDLVQQCLLGRCLPNDDVICWFPQRPAAITSHPVTAAVSAFGTPFTSHAHAAHAHAAITTHPATGVNFQFGSPFRTDLT